MYYEEGYYKSGSLVAQLRNAEANSSTLTITIQRGERRESKSLNNKETGRALSRRKLAA
jgi:hypothetical protein